MPYLPYLRANIKINNNLLFALLDFVVVGMCVYVVLFLSYSSYGERRVLWKEKRTLFNHQKGK
jgi:hypothetical protein